MRNYFETGERRADRVVGQVTMANRVKFQIEAGKAGG
jgi:hypothetical protein